MATRIAFSTQWPERMKELAGKPTYFHYKIASGLGIKSLLGSCNPMYLHPKTTTIRSNYEYWKSKEGQLLQPFFWAGKPYRSNHVVFCPEVRLKKVSKVEIRHYEPNENANTSMWSMYDIHKYGTLKLWDRFLDREEIKLFTESEGFDDPDHFWMWFNQDFSGAYLELENAQT